VFLEDKKTYDNAMNLFQKRVPTYIYLEKDGKSPKTNGGKSQSWFGQEEFGNKGQNGQITVSIRSSARLEEFTQQIIRRHVGIERMLGIAFLQFPISSKRHVSKGMTR